MISVENLVKEFPKKDGTTFYAVDNISFEAKEGEIVCLLGVNGAGKTTTMRILSTVFRPSSGTAKIKGWDILTHPHKVRENLGFLSGDTGLYNRLRVFEFIQYFGRLYSMPESVIDQRMKEMAELLDMNDFMDKKIEFLSTGMKQKVSIVRSIIHDPPVMIFDEPTAGLDILTARNIISFIRSCKDRGKCVLFSTHIMREAERLADRVVMIHKGKLLAEGSLDELRAITNQTDLDDIFVHYVNQVNGENEVQAHEF
ncbi:MAG: ATP-binding cassette domain-containing protein [Candidatus Cloacimonetes bacterium]|jgi:sodium transport system ATP-binding protein|nr:ATP-binding cassette domain-containing protein [Candidatus Cloacimonadota bacterium]MDY0298746.1 ATP-binding cassette domain-containing protein [Candidatus Cloacimonadaceae bacterium]MCB5278750.1 ATP-binding cassette domain-containing protein [Candidatus Cloacimonadota bacterium]MCK9332786.1 ATP-binding cassette domain-containing protein [Candidatus Cloacimonadota bacterium]MDD2210423.1 ATP-binding cassette domain-containing protein [Candidatus Cloacimonadota bacterium]